MAYPISAVQPFCNDHPNTDPSDNDCLVLTEGDTWFTLGGIPTLNLLFSIRFKKVAMIHGCGSPDDTIKYTSQIYNHLFLKMAALKAQVTG